MDIAIVKSKCETYIREDCDSTYYLNVAEFKDLNFYQILSRVTDQSYLLLSYKKGVKIKRPKEGYVNISTEITFSRGRGLIIFRILDNTLYNIVRMLIIATNPGYLNDIIKRINENEKGEVISIFQDQDNINSVIETLLKEGI